MTDILIMEKTINYVDIIQFTSNGVIVTDESGNIVLINRQSEKILNLDADKHTGKPVLEILPLTGSHIMKCLETGLPVLGRQVLGQNVKLMVNVSPIFKKTRIQGTVCNFQELSVFENSAKNLESHKKLARQLETIFQASSDGIWVCDGKGRVISINEASERFNGIVAEDIVGRHVSDLVNEKLFDQSVTLMVLKSGRQESILQKTRNTGRDLLVTGTPAFDENGDISLVVVNERDITELNRLRGEIEKTRMITEKYREELAELSMRGLKRNEIVAESDKMRHVLHMALKLSRIGASNILLLGESGTGKGMLARFIHNNSNRGKNSFVQVNCAALPENLLEAELFGYEKGAFTGANEKGKAGLFELARDGTLFLDEIGDMPQSIQAKILTCLDDNEIRRLGGTKAITVNCSIIAATNRNLDEWVRQKKFREDLFYRLNSFVLSIPPLRERPEDIFELAGFYLRKYNTEYKTAKKIGAEAMNALQSHSFSGNVRELKSIVKKAVVLGDHDAIDPVILASMGKSEPDGGMNDMPTPGSSLPEKLLEVERQILAKAMNQCKNTRQMAEMLGISQPTVVRKMKKHKDLSC